MECTERQVECGPKIHGDVSPPLFSHLGRDYSVATHACARSPSMAEVIPFKPKTSPDRITDAEMERFVDLVADDIAKTEEPAKRAKRMRPPVATYPTPSTGEIRSQKGPKL